MYSANNAGTFPVSHSVTANTAMTHKQVINDAAQKILSFVDLIIIVTDEDGIILEANQSACELFCYTAEELTGMPVHFLLPPRYRERHVDALRQFVIGGETQRRMGQRDSVIGYRKDGTLIELDAGIAKFHSGGQWILVVSMTDVTQRTEQIVGAELLLRWNLNGKSISPEIFIPVAEMTGMVFSIGDWVFREGCKAQADWQRRWGDQAPYVSINLSARQLNHKQLLNNFSAILQETGANPAKIVVELTEAALMPDVESNLTVFHRLADLGLQIAIDEFGTGYSSLAQLIQLPINLLKISKSFVDDLESQHEKQVLIRTVIGLGHSLGLKLIVEGVETEAQLAELKQYGCDFIQGYFFYLPMHEQDFIRAMNHQASKGDKDLMV